MDIRLRTKICCKLRCMYLVHISAIRTLQRILACKRKSVASCFACIWYIFWPSASCNGHSLAGEDLLQAVLHACCTYAGHPHLATDTRLHPKICDELFCMYLNHILASGTLLWICLAGENLLRAFLHVSGAYVGHPNLAADIRLQAKICCNVFCM